MTLRDVVRRLKSTTQELDNERLIAQCAALGGVPIDQVEDRTVVELVGEVRSVRIVPRAGSPSLEVSISDGHGTAVAVFFGRKGLAGIGPGRSVRFTGRAQRLGGRVMLYNPAYDFVA